MKLQSELLCKLPPLRFIPSVTGTISEIAIRIDAGSSDYLIRQSAKTHNISNPTLASGENSATEARDTTFSTAGEAASPDSGNCRDQIFRSTKWHRKQGITTPRSGGRSERVSLLQ